MEAAAKAARAHLANMELIAQHKARTGQAWWLKPASSQSAAAATSPSNKILAAIRHGPEPVRQQTTTATGSRTRASSSSTRTATDQNGDSITHQGEQLQHQDSDQIPHQDSDQIPHPQHQERAMQVAPVLNAAGEMNVFFIQQ